MAEYSDTFTITLYAVQNMPHPFSLGLAESSPKVSIDAYGRIVEEEKMIDSSGNSWYS
jgi:hypothetical protein